MQNILIITYIPSPYQVELFNAIALLDNFKLQVAYLKSNCDAPIAKHWQQHDIQHDYVILDECEKKFQQLEQDAIDSDLVVFNYYRHSRLSQLMDRCLELNKPWCFWGERPGFKHAGLFGWLYRRWKLASLHESSAPIWGVGIWGVERYRNEFGISRNYFDLPYFSDLSRFNTLKHHLNKQKRVFLYSGALIERKGVDLLASAFCQLVEQFDKIELHFVGEGELRPSLEKKLAKYQSHVKFHGFQPWEKLPHYYQQADVLCVPSRYDGWGMVVPEGLAAGLPVIGTDSTGAAIELIRDGQNGWLIDANSEESLKEAILQAIKLTPEELTNYSQAANDRAIEHSLANGVQRFEQTAAETIRLFAINASQEIQIKGLTTDN